MDDVTMAVTSDLKRAGDHLYLVGRTRDEMAGSALYAQYDASHPDAPGVDLKALSGSIDAMLEAHSNSWIRACHDVSDGGLAVALAEMCIGGQLGVDVDISGLDRIRQVAALFSESNTRWVVEVSPAKARHLQALMRKAGVPLARLGSVVGPKAVKGEKGKARKGKAGSGEKDAGTSGAEAGGRSPFKVRSGKTTLVDLTVLQLEEAWRKPFWEKMG